MTPALASSVSGHLETGTLERNKTPDPISEKTSSLLNPTRRTGRWTPEEHKKFVNGLEHYGKNWKKISAHIRTRTPNQTRTHAQKYFLKKRRNKNLARKEESLNEEKNEQKRAATEGASKCSIKSAKRAKSNEVQDTTLPTFDDEELNKLKRKSEPDEVGTDVLFQALQDLPMESPIEVEPFVIPNEFDASATETINTCSRDLYIPDFDIYNEHLSSGYFQPTCGLQLDLIFHHEWFL